MSITTPDTKTKKTQTDARIILLYGKKLFCVDPEISTAYYARFPVPKGFLNVILHAHEHHTRIVDLGGLSRDELG
jgi:hypothetical protein